MLWKKIVGAAFVAIIAIGMAARPAGSDTKPETAGKGEIRREKDRKGREWLLENWKEGSTFPAPEDPKEFEEWERKLTRPYPRDLEKREKWYRETWGEDWDGARERARILTPGTWKLDITGELPEPYASKVKPPKARGGAFWGGGWPEAAVVAPGAGDVTDVYGSGRTFFMHIDAKTAKVTYIGHPEAKGGCSDGINEKIAVQKGYGHKLAVDTVRGRLFWLQRVADKQMALRYLEKLLPYREEGKDGEVHLLPSVLAYRDMYKTVKGPNGGSLKPELTGGAQTPSFAVRTIDTIPQRVTMPGVNGRHPLLVPEGTAVYLSRKVGDHGRLAKISTLLDSMELFSFTDGSGVPVKFAGPYPELRRPRRGFGNGPGSHGSSCMGIDGVIYLAQTGGCGSHALRVFSFDPKKGIMRTLANSIGSHWKKSEHKRGLWDGPADAWSLCGSSTKYAGYCPRTGGFYFAGWDWAGLRRYHDGFVTSVLTAFGRKAFGKRAPVSAAAFKHNNCNPAVAPNGDLYIPDAGSQRVFRVYRTDWPKEQPPYGYGEKFLPRKKIEELMLEYANEYIAGLKKQQ
jgi:hypothetical protein